MIAHPHDYRFVMLTTMKDEAPYIFDWVSYHLSIGFTHFVIMTNDCSDGTDKICRNLEKLGIVTHFNNKEPYPRGIQKTAWKRAKRLEAVQKADWLMVLDVDEYLRVDVGDGHIENILETCHEQACAISFVWQVFGNQNIQDITDRPVIEQFTRSAHPFQSEPYKIRGLKTLFKNDCFEAIGTHRPQGQIADASNGRIWITADGTDMSYMNDGGYWCVWNEGLGYGGALGRVHHYALRSFDAFLLKLERGFVNRTKKGPRASSSPKEYWDTFNWNHYEDHSLLNRSDQAKVIKNELLSDHKFLRLHSAGLDWHLNKVNKLKNENELHDDLLSLSNGINQNGYETFQNEENRANSPIFSIKEHYQIAKKGILSQEIVDEYYRQFAK